MFKLLCIFGWHDWIGKGLTEDGRVIEQCSRCGNFRKKWYSISV